MRDSLSYKGYVGSVHFNFDDEVSYGKIVGVDERATVRGISLNRLVQDALQREVGTATGQATDVAGGAAQQGA